MHTCIIKPKDIELRVSGFLRAPISSSSSDSVKHRMVLWLFVSVYLSFSVC